MELERWLDLGLALLAAAAVLLIVLRLMRPVPPGPGDVAPDFSLSDQDGFGVTLSHLAGRWVVLSFYPRVDSRGGTALRQSLKEVSREIGQLGATILMISADGVERLRRVSEREAPGFGLLADPLQEALLAYGALHSWLPNPGRRTVIVDPRGVVRGVWAGAGGSSVHGREVLRRLALLVESTRIPRA